ncbi:MAG TPA: aquaporin [Polyangiaceae bacterium]|nr:aquaporin [Polyangiaceae bacterium]
MRAASLSHRSETLHRARRNWPEYLIEGWALGTFMIAAGVCATLLDWPGSPLHRAISDPALRRVIGGVAMGVTAAALIYSPWGQRSGAHMNPAVTLTFLRLGKIHRDDALAFVLAQFGGGTVGVLIVAALLGSSFTSPPVRYAATVPGSGGVALAFAAELIISAVLMLVVLIVSNTPRVARYTGIAAGTLVATYIAVEAPLSGMSMNPARSFASAAPGAIWQDFWIYCTAPVLGMLAGAQLFLLVRGAKGAACAKLMHPADQRCIHCGHEP